MLREKARLGTPLTNSDRIMMKRLDIDIKQLGLQTKTAKDKLDADKEETQILDKQDLFKDKPAEELKSGSHSYNKKYDTNEVFHFDSSYFGGDKVKSITIPKGTKINGKPATSKLITEIAESKGVSIEKVLDDLAEKQGK